MKNLKKMKIINKNKFFQKIFYIFNFYNILGVNIILNININNLNET